MTPEQYLDEHEDNSGLSFRQRALMAMEKYANEMSECAFNLSRDRLFNPDGTFREYKFVNYEHYFAYIENAKRITKAEDQKKPPPSNKQVLIDLLNNIITALYPNMGKEWCEEMDSLISKLKPNEYSS